MGGGITEYERRRLENIKRNEEMLAALKVHSRLNDLTAAAAASKRQGAGIKSYKKSPVKKPKTESPVVLRRSLRTRGVPPDGATASGLSDDFDDKKRVNKTPQLNSHSTKKKSPREKGPLGMRDAYTGDDELDKKFMESILQCSKKSMSNGVDEAYCGSIKLEKSEDKGSIKLEISEDKCSSIKLEKSEAYCGSIKLEKSEPYCGSIKLEKSEPYCGSIKLEKSEDFEIFQSIKRLLGSVDVNALQLKSDNIARVVPGRIMSLKFLPSVDMQMVVVGNKFGDIGFWNVNGKKEDGDGIYLYHPHSGPISGIVIDPFSISKMYSSCYDGFIRLMDVEKEVFHMVYASEYTIYSMCQSPHDIKSLYFGEGKGGVNMWDVRAGKSSLSCDLHQDRINTIDFNPEVENIMATSSTDGTACIWDLRQLNADKPTPLKSVSHKRAVYSAYFSPTGKLLATTSIDDQVGLFSGANYENESMVYHYNQTGRWISTFRGIWGWDDSSVYIGNMKRGVDVISVAGKKRVATLESDLLSAIPCRFDAHPCNVGMLAGATSGGQVYIWTLS